MDELAPQGVAAAARRLTAIELQQQDKRYARLVVKNQQFKFRVLCLR